MDGQKRSAIFGAATGFGMRAVLLALGLIGAALPAQGAPGDTELVSVTADGKGAGGWAMGISPDARFVVFTAQSTNVVPGGNPANSLFLKDRLLGTTKIVVPGGGVDFASVSADGRYVAFVCYTSLVPADTNDQRRYLRSRSTRKSDIPRQRQLKRRPGNQLQRRVRDKRQRPLCRVPDRVDGARPG